MVVLMKTVKGKLPLVHQLISINLQGSNIHGAISYAQPIKTLSQLIPDIPKNSDQSKDCQELSTFIKKRVVGTYTCRTEQPCDYQK